MERQKAGFDYQEQVIQKYNLQPDNNYTGHWDAYYRGVPVSIKLEKYHSDIEMADIFRQSQITEDFYLICGFWQGNPQNVIEEHLLFIPAREYSSYFNSALLLDFQSLLKSISNNYEDDEKWKRAITKYKKDWRRTTNNFIRPRFKRDHKQQKRIQCAINNRDFFFFFLPKYEVIQLERDNQISRS